MSHVVFNAHTTAFAKPDSLLESWKESVKTLMNIFFFFPCLQHYGFLQHFKPRFGESRNVRSSKCWCISVLPPCTPVKMHLKGRSAAGYDFWVAFAKKDRKWRNKKKKGSVKQNCLCFLSFQKELLQALSSPASFGGSGKSLTGLEKITGKTILSILQTIAV